MITNERQEGVRGWFAGRLPQEWQVTAAQVVIDREEITILLGIGDVDHTDKSEAEVAGERSGRASRFREDTRDARIAIAKDAQHRFERKVSWGVSLGASADGPAYEERWTHVAAPVMTRLRQPQRLVLDTLVDAGVAKSRSEALAWCVRLVGQHEGDWLAELRAAMESVAAVRSQGPTA